MEQRLWIYTLSGKSNDEAHTKTHSLSDRHSANDKSENNTYAGVRDTLTLLSYRDKRLSRRTKEGKLFRRK